jgi:hypothetical protein
MVPSFDYDNYGTCDNVGFIAVSYCYTKIQIWQLFNYDFMHFRPKSFEMQRLNLTVLEINAKITSDILRLGYTSKLVFVSHLEYFDENKPEYLISSTI